MKLILNVDNGSTPQVFCDTDFPLSVGINLNEILCLGGDVKSNPIACFGLHNDHVFLQVEKSTPEIKINDKSVLQSTWLKTDDTIQINDTTLTLKIVPNDAALSTDARSEIPAVVPPKILGTPTLSKLPKKKNSAKFRRGWIALFVFLLLCVIFVLISSPVRLETTPSADKISIKGFIPPIMIGNRYLTLPGQYSVMAKKKGYRNFKKSISIKMGSKSTYNYELQKLPGLLFITSQPLENAEVKINGRIIGKTPLSAYEIGEGDYELMITLERYLPDVQIIQIEGMGIRQSIDVALEPGWGTLHIASLPKGFDVKLNGKIIGQTPLTAEPMEGKHTLDLSMKGWKSVQKSVKIRSKEVLTLPVFEMQRVDGTLELTSNPTGATVMINDKFWGMTPISISLVSEKKHNLSLSKPGFKTTTQTIRLEQNKTKELNVPLQPEYGIVFINSQPADAALKVDGNLVKGFASQRLSLTSVPHTIEIRKKGYESYMGTVTPTVDISKRINVKLKTNRQVLKETVLPEIKTSQGQVLQRILLIDPIQIQLGASRRESGRRSNETQQIVELSRTFDISVKEVTNSQFKQFQPEHNSGRYEGFDLDEANQPVVSVGWNQAAAYLNWLSKKEGLPPAYEKKGEQMIAVKPMTTGYRLPTEAEWAFVSRYEGTEYTNKKPLKYPWGQKRTPAPKSGNYADSSASDNLPSIIRNYTDGYKVSSPVGKFPPNAIGIYDLGGNVSEWCHDYYDIHIGGQSNVLTNPMGSNTGEYHVVRGSSWRHGSITELRLSYRDYTNKSRNDLGFRIARYAKKHTQN